MNVTLPLTITPSRVGEAAKCHRAHFVRNVLCLEPLGEVPAALTFGTSLHAAAAAKWRGLGGAVMRAAALATFQADGGGDDRHTAALLEQLVTQYDMTALPIGPHWSGDLAGTTVRALAVEERITLDLGPLATLSFQLDRLMQVDLPGLPSVVGLVDTKSASRCDQRWRRQWALDLQQRLYQAAVRRQYGVPLDVHVVEGVEKFGTGSITYVPIDLYDDSTLDEAIAHAIRLVQRDAKIVAQAQRDDGTVDMDDLLWRAVIQTDISPTHCFDWGRTCALYDACRGPAAGRERFLQTFVHVTPTYLE